MKAILYVKKSDDYFQKNYKNNLYYKMYDFKKINDFCFFLIINLFIKVS